MKVVSYFESYNVIIMFFDNINNVKWIKKREFIWVYYRNEFFKKYKEFGNN